LRGFNVAKRCSSNLAILPNASGIGRYGARAESDEVRDFLVSLLWFWKYHISGMFHIRLVSSSTSGLMSTFAFNMSSISCSCLDLVIPQ
jgi:hypothetical protein